MDHLIATTRKAHWLGRTERNAASATRGQRELPLRVVLGQAQESRFACRECGAKHVWSAQEQTWWYDTPHGFVYASTVPCLACQRERRLAFAAK